jgi:hypothetical protein
MAKAIAIAKATLHADRTEWSRRLVVCGSALALILAGRALPL